MVPFFSAMTLLGMPALMSDCAPMMICGDAAGLLFDAPPEGGMPGGTGRTFDWSRLPRLLPRPLVLSGGLTPANVRAAVLRLSPWAVDVSSGVEATGADGKPEKGVKDPAKIAAFIEEVRDADG